MSVGLFLGPRFFPEFCLSVPPAPCCLCHGSFYVHQVPFQECAYQPLSFVISKYILELVY